MVRRAKVIHKLCKKNTPGHATVDPQEMVQLDRPWFRSKTLVDCFSVSIVGEAGAKNLKHVEFRRIVRMVFDSECAHFAKGPTCLIGATELGFSNGKDPDENRIKVMIQV